MLSTALPIVYLQFGLGTSQTPDNKINRNDHCKSAALYGVQPRLIYVAELN